MFVRDGVQRGDAEIRFRAECAQTSWYQLLVVWSYIFVRDGALCYQGDTPGGRLRCTWGRRTRSGEHRDRRGRLFLSSVVLEARTGEAGRWGQMRRFGSVRRNDEHRHPTR